MTERSLYHFTSRASLDGILADGLIRTTDPNLRSMGRRLVHDLASGLLVTVGNPSTGQPVVWLVDEADPPDNQHGLGRLADPNAKRAIRFAVRVPDARRWLDWLTARKHDDAWAKALIQTGGGRAAARHWFVVPRPIPASDWVEVRDMTSGEVIA